MPDYTDLLQNALPADRLPNGRAFAFSVHKAGSSLMNAMLTQAASKAGIPSLNVPEILFNKGIPDQEWQANAELADKFCHDVLYLGFRLLPPVLKRSEVNLKSSPFVLLVRDPRDVLVSQYFSFGTSRASHARPKDNADAFNASIASRIDVGLEAYVLEYAEALRDKLESYRSALDFDRGVVHRYEQVYYDKQAFLTETFKTLRINVPANVIAEVTAVNDIRPVIEDKTKHIRQGTPGDHTRKLTSETIAKLNETLAGIAAFYGYDLT